jgi:hypothetical protein
VKREVRWIIRNSRKEGKKSNGRSTQRDVKRRVRTMAEKRRSEFGREELEREAKHHSELCNVFASKVQLNLRMDKKEEVRRRGGCMMGCKHGVQAWGARMGCKHGVQAWGASIGS